MLENAYDDFANKVFKERHKAADMDAFYNSLCYVQAELKSLWLQRVDVFEKNTHIRLLEKAILLVDEQLGFAKENLHTKKHEQSLAGNFKKNSGKAKVDCLRGRIGRTGLRALWDRLFQ